MTNAQPTAPIGLFKQAIHNALSYFELGIFFNAVAITSLWLTTLVVQSLFDTTKFGETEAVLCVAVTFALVVPVLYYGARMYKTRFVTTRQRWQAVGLAYIYTLASIPAMYYTIT